MTRDEVAGIVLVGLMLLISGLAWLFGAWALVGCGAALLLASFFIQVKE